MERGDDNSLVSNKTSFINGKSKAEIEADSESDSGQLLSNFYYFIWELFFIFFKKI
jgi:hypothetical protein